jgi:peptidoglycan/LPS O-acetylase OafA/YrhL
VAQALAMARVTQLDTWVTCPDRVDEPRLDVAMRITTSSHIPSGDRQSPPGYHAGLDGLRALSVAAVLLYHGGVPWARGGFLGVEIFFVLSGFLITSLLVREWMRRSRIGLKAFWGRRARRLLPALVCLVAVIGIYYVDASPNRAVPGLRADGLATLLYVGNWHQLAVGSNYFAANGPTSPLEHTWSLAIEEQFYLLWPLLVVGLLWLGRRHTRSRSRRPLVALLIVTLLGVLASAIDTALRLHGGRGLDRVYYGTDTRAAGLLMGAALAIVLALVGTTDDGVAARNPGRRRSMAALAPFCALGAVLVILHLANSSSMWLFPYGLFALDLAVLALIAGIVLAPRSPLARMFSLKPLRTIGVISYGIYLWHFPLFLWLDEPATGLSGTPLLLFRLTVTLLVSAVSFWLIEQPIRRRQVPKRLMRPLVPIAVGGAVATLLVGSAALANPPVPRPQPTAPWLRGSDPPCRVGLADTSEYGLSPLSPAQAATDEPAWLVGHRLRWNSSSSLTFRTCPPKRVLLIGDSLAFTLGVGFMENEQAYGVEVADAAILGCAFNNRGELNSRGNWEAQYAGCPTALQQWARDERRLRADAVIVELGYRDEFDWRWNGHVVHLGEAAYDAFVRARVEQYVQVLGHGRIPILFLNVPWSDPAPLPDGSPAPAASPARHKAINTILSSVAAEYPGRVGVLDIDGIVSPSNQYHSSLNGKLCRFDGVHFTVYCSRVLQPSVLTAVRKMLLPLPATPSSSGPGGN